MQLIYASYVCPSVENFYSDRLSCGAIVNILIKIPMLHHNVMNDFVYIFSGTFGHVPLVVSCQIWVDDKSCCCLIF